MIMIMIMTIMMTMMMMMRILRVGTKSWCAANAFVGIETIAAAPVDYS